MISLNYIECRRELFRKDLSFEMTFNDCEKVKQVESLIDSIVIDEFQLCLFKHLHILRITNLNDLLK